MTHQTPVIIDSREQLPLPFPATVICPRTESGTHDEVDLHIITTQVEALPEGDYCLGNNRAGTVVERKYRYLELIKNASAVDRRRQESSLRRLSLACSYPCLLLEDTPFPDERGDPKAIRALHMLFGWLTAYRISLLWFGPQQRSERARKRLGEYILRIMLSNNPRLE